MGGMKWNGNLEMFELCVHSFPSINTRRVNLYFRNFSRGGRGEEGDVCHSRCGVTLVIHVVVFSDGDGGTCFMSSYTGGDTSRFGRRPPLAVFLRPNPSIELPAH